MEHGEEKRIMTAQEVSERLRISLSTVHHLTRTGKIKGVKMGKQWRYVREDIERCLTDGLEMDGSSRPPRRLERRDKPRLNCHIRATAGLALSPLRRWSGGGIVLNLSEGGLLFEATQGPDEGVKFQVNDPLMVRLRIPPMSSQEVTLQGRIVHLRANGTLRLGVKFRNLDPDCQKVIREYVG